MEWGLQITPAARRMTRRMADRCERVAQLVGEHRQELVLAQVGVGQRILIPLALRDVDSDAPTRVSSPSRTAMGNLLTRE